MADNSILGSTKLSEWVARLEDEHAAMKQELKERRSEIERANRHLKGHENHTPDNCPVYYDGCNCTVEVLQYNIDRADLAASKNEDFRRTIQAALAELLETRWMSDSASVSLTEWSKTPEGLNHTRVMAAIEKLREAL